jgi:hypothetical protein
LKKRPFFYGMYCLEKERPDIVGKVSGSTPLFSTIITLTF